MRVWTRWVDEVSNELRDSLNVTIPEDQGLAHERKAC